MTEFQEAKEALLKGKGDALLKQYLLSDALPEEKAKPFILTSSAAFFPYFNGVVPITPILHLVLTPELLENIGPDSLNYTLEEAVKKVCAEGNAEQGFEVLDRLVKAGGRVDGMKNRGKDLTKPKTIYEERLYPEIMSATNDKPVRLGEKITTQEEIEDYVNRLVAEEGAINNKPLKRGGPTRKSQFQLFLEKAPAAKNQSAQVTL